VERVVVWLPEKYGPETKKEEFADKIHQLEQGSDMDATRSSLHSKYQIS
jgi:hypothetical protein